MLIINRQLVICMFFCTCLFAGNFGYQFGLESGMLKERQEDHQTILRLIARFRYTQPFQKNNLSIKLRLAPEGYFAQSNSSVFRTSGKISFSIPHYLSGWNLYLNAKHYQYSLLEANKQSYFLLISGLNNYRILSNKVSHKTDITAIYRRINAVPDHRLLGLQLKPAVSIKIHADYSVHPGLYGEVFQISSSDSVNEGGRFGVSLSLKKSRNPLISFSYLILFNKNSIQNKVTTEQHFELLAGKSLSNRWSLFFYLNYYLLPDIDQNIPLELVYTPLNTQNWIYLQPGFDLTPKSELYCRLGYIYEEVNYGLQTIQGWQILIGLNLLI